MRTVQIVLLCIAGVLGFYLLSKVQMHAWMDVLERRLKEHFKDQQTINTNNDEKEQE